LLPTQPFIYKDDNGKKMPLSKEKVRTILTSAELQISSELQLIIAVEKWSEQVLENKKKKKSFLTVRSEVDYLLKSLRVLSLEMDELEECLRKTMLYSDDEKERIRYAYRNKVLYI
jgi:Holliday junction resolvase RusA-like endonuclease